MKTLLGHLIAREEKEEGFEVEEEGGLVQVFFEDDPSARFVLTPQGATGQLWLSASLASYKLDWDEAAGEFCLGATGEGLRTLVDRLLNAQLGQ